MLNIDKAKLTGVKKPAGIYLIAVAVLVAVYFAINSFFVPKFDVMIVWHVLDVLMLTGLGLALFFNYVYKRDAADRDETAGITRRYLEANVLFFVTAGLMLAFLHNWFFLLADGNASLTTYVWNAWTVIDVVLPIIFGVTGCRLMREGA